MYRPLSPHILIYKPQFSSLFSVLHRVTGVALAFGLTFILFWLCLTFFSPLRAHYFIYLTSFTLNTYLAWVSVAALYTAVLGLLYHMLSGIRHIIWDFFAGSFLTKTSVIKSSYVILAASITAYITIIFIL